MRIFVCTIRSISNYSRHSSSFAYLRRASYLLELFGSVLAPTAFPVFNARSIQPAPYYMILDTRQVLNSATAQCNHRVLLQIVSHAGNIRRYFHAVGQPHAGKFTQGGIRFLGSHRSDLYRYSALERRRVINWPVLFAVKPERQSRRSGFRFGLFARMF